MDLLVKDLELAGALNHSVVRGSHRRRIRHRTLPGQLLHAFAFLLLLVRILADLLVKLFSEFRSTLLLLRSFLLFTLLLSLL